MLVGVFSVLLPSFSAAREGVIFKRFDNCIKKVLVVFGGGGILMLGANICGQKI
jgi:hypothetical protein